MLIFVQTRRNAMKSKSVTRMLAILMSALLLTAFIPALGTAEVSEAATDEGKKAYDEYMRTEPPDQYTDPKYEPYGYGKDVPFMMNRQSELLFYMTNEDSPKKITSVYDKLKAGNLEDIFKGATRSDPIDDVREDLKKAAFVQAVAFDPRGCGREDHVAFIGVNANKKAYVWVYDTRNKLWYKTGGNNGGFSIADCRWMQNRDLTDYEAVNFLSITAGDYDGDGKDTIIAYAAGDVASTGDGDDAVEIKVDTPDVGASGSISLQEVSRGDKFIWSEKFLESGYDETIVHKIGCDLDTGDFDGDGIDDLVTVCYYGNADNHNQEARLYRPWLCISYGGTSRVLSKVNKKVGLWEGRKDESASAIKDKNWKSLVSPSLTTGDIDNDGADEIIAAGIKNTIHANGAANAGNPADIDSSKIEVFIVKNGDTAQKEISANPWTTEGFYPNEDAWTKTEAECVAINGPGNQEMVFISGSLYSIDKDSWNLTEMCTPDYFMDDSDNLSSKSSTNMFVQSAAAGNFDGNTKGYEQVVFAVSCKTSGSDHYDYLMGVIGGKDHNSTTGIASGYYKTNKGSMDDDNSYPDRDGGSNIANNISENNGLNCVPVAMDCDTDGVLARYKEKCMVYADPEVACVLQAPPYFKQMADYLTDSSSNNYNITNSFTYETSTSDSVSYGVGVVAGMESPAIQMEMTAGYALDWSKTFTNALTTKEYLEFSAKERDLVIVMRKPIVCYKYQLQSADGSWGDEHAVVSVPYDSKCWSMSVSKYNAFANYYNKTVGAKLSGDFHKLGILNNEWLGHEGDPRKYIKWTNSKFKTDDGYRIFQQTPLMLGHTSESVGWGRSVENSVGVTESMAHGFTYDATIAMGPNVGAASLYVGLSTSLQYMTENSTTQTKTQEMGISCEINAIKADTPASLHPEDYNFSFKMARWPSGLKRYVEGKAEDVPVYGFALSGVTVPASLAGGVPVEDQLSASTVTEKINELPAAEDVTLSDEPKISEAREMYNNLSSKARKLVSTSELEALEARIDLIKAGGVDLDSAKIVLSAKTFTYNGKVQRPSVKTVDGYRLIDGVDYDVELSGESKEPGSYTMTIIGKGLASGTAQEKYTIIPKGTSLSKVASAKKALKVTWKKQTAQTTGYQIQYSLKKSFKGAKTKTVSGVKKTSLTIKKLKAKKKYYVRIRTYKQVGKTKYCSAWSKAKYAKTK